jgi:hypothetical protein
VLEPEAYGLSERQCEDISRAPAREFQGDKEADSLTRQQTPKDVSSLGEYPALTGRFAALTFDKGTSADNQPRDSTDGVTPANVSCAKQMIGDFDDSANALWSLHGKEAKSHDEARIQSLKDDMEGVLIFVRFLSLFGTERD